LLSVTGSLANTLGADNPLRYRGYVYDTQTRLYYLQSRYYDPEIGRFINADVALKIKDCGRK
jgi:RHS repeat-associated protein